MTFVDDECIMPAADDPKSLASAIDCCTVVLSTTIHLLKLEVNWRPRKTECLVQMVGKVGRGIVEKWRCDDGSLSNPVPYRHLGTIVMAAERPSSRFPREGSKWTPGVAHFCVSVDSSPAEVVIVQVFGRVSQLLFDAHCTTVIQRPSDCCF